MCVSFSALLLPSVGGSAWAAGKSRASHPQASHAKAKPGKFSLLRLHNAYKNAGSLQADFVQEVYQASLARTKTSKGSLRLAKPNLVRWEIYEPEASVMVSDGSRLFYFTPDARGKGKGQVIVHKARDLTQQPLFRILTGTASLQKEFTVEKEQKTAALPGQEALTEVVLRPKKQMDDLQDVVLKVNAKYLIAELILETQSGNKTKITLQNQTLGAKLPAQIFAFKPPPGTEEVRN
jgi:outer membrane lipoprotein carrier protein